MRTGLAESESRYRPQAAVRTKIQIICAAVDKSDKEQYDSQEHQTVGEKKIGEYLMKYHSENGNAESQALPYTHYSSFGCEIFSDDLF